MEKKYKLAGFIIPTTVGIFNILIILFPVDMIAAARDGLWLWSNSVVPSLLPFVILINILSASGALALISRLLEPMMRPLFGVSGIGGFAFTAGMVSGYPVGAKITAQLRADGLITRIEAQRLLAFCNNSGPLFMLGAVGVSMFGSAKLGYFIMVTHYISALITGLIFRYYGTKSDAPLPHRAWKAPGSERPLVSGSQSRPPSFGAVLGSSVKNAVETLALVGGFIILFSVIVKIMEITHLAGFASPLLGGVLGVSNQTAGGLLTGIIEVTNGARAISGDNFSREQITAVCAVIAFGGFCIHAQTISFIAHTDIKASVYLIAKAMQAVIAAAAASLLFPFVVLTEEVSVPVFLTMESPFWQKLLFSTASFVVLGVVASALAGIAAWRTSRWARRKR